MSVFKKLWYVSLIYHLLLWQDLMVQSLYFVFLNPEDKSSIVGEASKLFIYFCTSVLYTRGFGLCSLTYCPVVFVILLKIEILILKFL